jgi:hypothetical protein
MRMIGVVLTPLSGACISGDLLLYYSVCSKEGYLIGIGIQLSATTMDDMQQHR